MSNYILIVDDNLKNIQVLANILSQNNYIVEFAENGTDAIEMVQKENFDLILLDIMMPDLNGFEVCQKIKSMDSKFDIPIIFVTARNDSESISKGFTIGGVDYITKPFDSVELIARVNTHIELKKSRDQQKNLNLWLEGQVAIKNKELIDAYSQLEKANAELLRLDEAKTEFLKIISHELRTPLNGIVAPFYFISEEIEAKNFNKNEVIEFIEIIKKSVTRLENFSVTALLITELKLNKYHFSLIELDVKQEIQAALFIFQPKIDEKKLNVHLNIENNLTLFGDMILVQTALKNVIENSIQYSNDSGSIHIIGDIFENYIRISFLDNGKGFSQKALDNLFGIFKPGEVHLDQNMGLDLYLTKMIMNKHNGILSISNNEPHGAKVSLYFKKLISA